MGFYSSLQGIPIDYLVATPLLAAARGNLALAQIMEEFVFTIGYKGGKPGGDTNVISFKLTRPFTDPDTGAIKSETITVNAPLIGLVPIPALLVDNVTVDFTTSLSTTTQDKSSASVTASASYGFGAFKASAKLHAQASHMRESNQSATYKFHVEAEQQPAVEGMSKMMDVFAATIEPIPAGGDKSGDDKGGDDKGGDA